MAKFHGYVKWHGYVKFSIQLFKDKSITFKRDSATNKIVNPTKYLFWKLIGILNCLNRSLPVLLWLVCISPKTRIYNIYFIRLFWFVWKSLCLLWVVIDPKNEFEISKQF